MHSLNSYGLSTMGNGEAGNWQDMCPVSCRLLILYACGDIWVSSIHSHLYCLAFQTFILFLDVLLVALNDDALVRLSYELACKVVCLSV